MVQAGDYFDIFLPDARFSLSAFAIIFRRVSIRRADCYAMIRLADRIEDASLRVTPQFSFQLRRQIISRRYQIISSGWPHYFRQLSFRCHFTITPLRRHCTPLRPALS